MPDLKTRYGVRSLGWFGSYARGSASEGSDVDLLVELPPAIGLEFVSLAGELEGLLGMMVDLVSTRSLTETTLAWISRDLIEVR